MNQTSYDALLSRAAEQLRQSGIGDARAEARRLLCLAAGLSSAALIAAERDPAPEEHCDAFRALVANRAARQPFAHIAGQTAFYGLTLKSDARALIPRSDSECVVDLALSLMPANAAWQIADLGTGSGALLAALLSQRPEARGIAIDASRDASALARENFDLLGLRERIESMTGSWSDWTGWGACDLIISNPPYIQRDVIATLEPEVRAHDPLDALDGGADGLDAYREIIALAATRMKPGAHLVLEIGYDQKASVSGLLSAHGIGDLQHRQDLGGQDRAIAATKT